MKDVRFLETKYGRIGYQRYGMGPKTIIALHGFGRSAHYFQKIGSRLAHQYTIYAIDLPFHGQSRWLNTQFTPAQFTLILNELIQVNGIDKFSFLGHSFGARIICTILDNYVDNTDAVFLLAPDGFATYWLGFPQRIPSGFRRWLQIQLRQPEWLIHLAKRLKRIQLLDPFVVQYLKYHLENAQRRERLFYTWNSLPEFGINTNALRKNLEKGIYALHIILGKNDQLISEKKLRKKLSNLPNTQMYTLSNGHRLDADEIGQIILNSHFKTKN